MTAPALSQVVAPSPASSGSRAVSYLIDLACCLLAAGSAWLLAGRPGVGLIVLLECGLVLTLMRATTGRTPGALLTRTVALAAGTGHAPGLTRQGARSALLAGLHLSVLGPLITALLARPGRDWVDGVVGTELMALRMAPRPVTTVDSYGRRTTTVGPATGTMALPQQPATPQVAAQQQGLEPEPATNGGLTLVLGSGARVPIVGTLVVGRSPDVDPASGARPVAVPDPTRSISRTHLRLVLAPDGVVWLEDAFSANGTVLRQPDGTLLEVEGGRSVAVQAGSTVLIGDHALSIQ